MKTFLSAIILLSSIVSAHCQYEDLPKIYHYAVAVKEEGETKTAYISAVSYIQFIEEYDYTQDLETINNEMSRQYLEYLGMEQGDNTGITFVTYEMVNDENLVKKKWKQCVSDYKKKGYKIKVIKGFTYD